MSVTSPHEFGKYVAAKVDNLQLGMFYMGGATPMKAWQGTTGQWIVYGLERSLGFNRTVDLCSVVEKVWRSYARKKDATGRTEAVAFAVENWLSAEIAAAKAAKVQAQ